VSSDLKVLYKSVIIILLHYFSPELIGLTVPPIRLIGQCLSQVCLMLVMMMMMTMYVHVAYIIMVLNGSLHILMDVDQTSSSTCRHLSFCTGSHKSLDTSLKQRQSIYRRYTSIINW